MTPIKKVIFLTGTRADFGKLKSLMLKMKSDPAFELHVFVTGMHMLAKYGYTCEEVERAGFINIHKYINQNSSDSMDCILAKTIVGLSDYVREICPDLIIIHGDRVEALAGAIVGSLNNILTGHIEGGEVSGTIDELIRHAVTKMSHVHFVANNSAQQRLIQLGERSDAIHVVGSPDIDIMNSRSLPNLTEVHKHYGINYLKYGVLAFHPVTTELNELNNQIKSIIDALEHSGRNYVVIYPNNDPGSKLILDTYLNKIHNHPRFKLLPSMRFEYYLTLLRHADFIVGNSSAGVREAPHFGVPSINIGSRQNNRVKSNLVLNVGADVNSIIAAIDFALKLPRIPEEYFGDGKSAEHFHKILRQENFWRIAKQKYFVDMSVN